MVFYRLPLSCLFLVLALLSFLARADNLIPAELLFNPNQARSHVLSPAGTKLAYLETSAGRTHLKIIDVEKLVLEESFNIGSESITQLFWLNEFRLIYNAEGRIKVINTKGTENAVLVNYVYDDEDWSGYYSILKNWRGWTIVDVLPNDPDNILLSGKDRKGYSTLSKINVYTGEKVDIADGAKLKIEEWVIDQNGNARIGIRNQKDRIHIFKVSGNDPRKLKLEPMTVDGHDLGFDGQSYVDQRVFVYAFSSNVDLIYLVENIDKDKFRLVEYDLDKSVIGRVILEDAIFDISNIELDSKTYSGIIFDMNTKDLVGVRYSTDLPKTVWFDKKLGEIQRKVDKSQPDTVNLILAWTADRDKYIVHSISEVNPGKTSIFIKSKNKLGVITDNPEIYKDHQLSSTEFFHYKARDGYEIPAYLTLPNTKEENELPILLVMPHGGPWARDFYGFDPLVQFFASRGYAVLQPQFRGSTGFGREHMLSAKKEFHGLMLDDIADGVQWMRKSKKVNDSKTFILGISYGGYAALMSAVRYPDLYTAAVSVASPIDLPKQMKYYRKEKYYFAYEYWRILAGDPKSDAKLLEAASPIHRISEMKIPIYAISGEKDPIIPVKHFEEFEDKLKKLSIKNITTQIFKNEGHGFNNSSNSIYFSEKALELFENNKGD